ncbi:MAG: hypothetical protein K2M88_07735 [Muribaculaceae bacterium]|nr:hypothetical protein [Muribaculaceae bacterium]
MKENNDIITIRLLLEKWYEGATTAAEELRLRNLLLSGNPLPADLEEERKLFSLIFEEYSDDAEIPQIPSEYADRINSALHSEMRKGRLFGGFIRRNMISRNMIIGAASCALILSAAFVTSHLISTDYSVKSKAISANLTDSNSNVNRASENESSILSAGNSPETQNEENPQKLNIDTLSLINLHSEGNRLAKNSDKASNKDSRDSGRKVKTLNPEISNEDKTKIQAFSNLSPNLRGGTSSNKSNTHESEFTYLSEEEEEMLARNNYRVIRDDKEAAEILNSIVSNIEVNMAIESMKMMMIETEYNVELNKYSNNDTYHEESQI